ncbi:MAG: M48 family metalloprotease [Gammaproteobacteria bacterium]|nr:M48 family metalloprotease [Gammaproteobacteria bacterium]
MSRFALAMLLTALVGVTAVRADPLPDLGDESAAALPPYQERQLGQHFMRLARQQLEFITDPEVNSYISQLGGQLAAQVQNDYDFVFFVIHDDTLNAFAVPGGFVGVHTGLILAARSESELASVLAHEVTHVTQRHIPRMLVKAKRLSLPTLLTVVAGAMIGGQAGQAAIAASAAWGIDQQIRFTRNYEREADRIGMGILAKAGFDPAGMPAFFQQLQNQSRLYDGSYPEFLMTHPVTADRVAESTARARQLPRPSQRPETDFLHVRAKVRVLTANDPRQLADGFADEARAGSAESSRAARYGQALALSEAREPQQARALMAALESEFPDYPAYRVGQARIEEDAGRLEAALVLYRQALEKFPKAPAMPRLYGEALLRAGHWAAAIPVLRRAQEQEPGDAALYKSLATARGNTGDAVGAHRALAEHYVLLGDLDAALRELYRAGGMAGENYYQAASIQARAEEIRRQRRARAPDSEDRSRLHSLSANNNF